jgi:hypothetical protein
MCYSCFTQPRTLWITNGQLKTKTALCIVASTQESSAQSKWCIPPNFYPIKKKEEEEERAET